MDFLISLIIVLVVIGLVMYLVNNYLPIPDPFRMIINVVIVIVVLVWLLDAVGILGGGFGLHRHRTILSDAPAAVVQLG